MSDNLSLTVKPVYVLMPKEWWAPVFIVGGQFKTLDDELFSSKEKADEYGKLKAEQYWDVLYSHSIGVLTE